MKSAYELAMERLKAADPETARELTGEQKKQLAEIDQRYKAKLAEREIFLRQQIAAAQAAGQAEELVKLNEQVRRERTRIEEEREDEKNKIRRKN
jgi:phosphate starvation-inducible protein PhoH